MIAMALMAVNWVAALVILILGLFYAINRMSGETIHCIRFAWICMTTGALSVLMAPLFGFAHPSFWQTLINVGIAVFLLADRLRGRSIAW
jgi:hypothetical protein